ncbi:hypothetical protein D3C83_133600 [compost metagenome]
MEPAERVRVRDVPAKAPVDDVDGEVSVGTDEPRRFHGRAEWKCGDVRVGPEAQIEEAEAPLT